MHWLTSCCSIQISKQTVVRVTAMDRLSTLATNKAKSARYEQKGSSFKSTFRWYTYASKRHPLPATGRRGMRQGGRADDYRPEHFPDSSAAYPRDPKRPLSRSSA